MVWVVSTMLSPFVFLISSLWTRFLPHLHVCQQAGFYCSHVKNIVMANTTTFLQRYYSIQHSPNGSTHVIDAFAFKWAINLIFFSSILVEQNHIPKKEWHWSSSSTVQLLHFYQSCLLTHLSIGSAPLTKSHPNAVILHGNHSLFQNLSRKPWPMEYCCHNLFWGTLSVVVAEITCLPSFIVYWKKGTCFAETDKDLPNSILHVPIVGLLMAVVLYIPMSSESIYHLFS